MNRNDTVKLSVNEFLAMFGRPQEHSRWMGFADSDEFLTLVTYLMGRSSRAFS